MPVYRNGRRKPARRQLGCDCLPATTQAATAQASLGATVQAAAPAQVTATQASAPAAQEKPTAARAPAAATSR